MTAASVTQSRADHRFRWLLLAIVALGVVLRVGAAWAGPECEIGRTPEAIAAARAEGRCISFNDSATYLSQATENAEGRWFHSRTPDGATSIDTALHAPAFGVVLAPLVAAGVDDLDGLRVAVAFFGALAIAAVALLARELGGDRAGLIAAAIAAFHPLVWINDVVMMPEGLFAAAVAGVGLVAYRFHARPTLQRALGLGAAIGGAGLIRNEALLCLVFIGLPLIGGLRRRPGAALMTRSERVARGAVFLAGAMLVLGPWVGFNWARFGEPVFTHGTGAGIRSAACDETFYNRTLIGLRSVDCLASDVELTSDIDPAAEGAEADTDEVYRQQASAYYRENIGRAPTVVLARVSRFWGAWRPFESVRLDDAIEQRGATRAQAGVVVGWLLLPLSIYGGLSLWRRRLPLSPLLGWVAASTMVAAVSQPLQRFRIGGDIGLLVLAAVGLVAALEVPAVRRTLGLDDEVGSEPHADSAVDG